MVNRTSAPSAAANSSPAQRQLTSTSSASTPRCKHPPVHHLVTITVFSAFVSRNCQLVFFYRLVSTNLDAPLLKHTSLPNRPSAVVGDGRLVAWRLAINKHTQPRLASPFSSFPPTEQESITSLRVFFLFLFQGSAV